MKTKSIGKTEVLVSLSNQEIIFLREVVKMYEDKRLGDIDDPTIDKIKGNGSRVTRSLEENESKLILFE
jgi:hypothetical protein